MGQDKDHSLQVVPQAKSAREPGIQGLRGIAATLVFLNHFGYVFFSSLDTHSRVFFASLSYLSLGSSIFILIAAYFTYGRFVTGTDLSVAAYIKRRLYRIMPLYWVILLAYIGFGIMAPMRAKVPGDVRTATTLILANATLTAPLAGVSQIVVSAWTLTFIVLVYLLVPALAKIQRALARLRWTGVVVPSAFAVLSIGAAAVTRYGTFCTTMAAGILLYQFRQTAGFQTLIERVGDKGSTAALIISSGLFRAAVLYVPATPAGRVAIAAAQLLFVAAVGVFVAARFVQGGRLNRLLASPVSRWIGDISYSQYLGHGIALYACKVLVYASFGAAPFSAPMIGFILPGCFAVSLGTAAVIHTCLERPLANLTGSRLIRAGAAKRIEPLAALKLRHP